MLRRNETKDFENALSERLTRRKFSVKLATLFSGLGFAGTALASSKLARSAAFPADDEIIRSAEAIHMEVSFSAAPARVYDALTEAKQFNRVVQLSAAMQSKSISDKPVEISREVGGAFSAFGGYVTGRQIELVPGRRIVQAWRAGSWAPGAYSIARFELSPQGTGTKLEFEHAGFPQGDAEHLLAGWKGNYWEPLAKFLAEAK
ncbi:MAG: SRPBCC domain-containing protein [Candidatus Acidiferrum sp.]